MEEPKSSQGDGDHRDERWDLLLFFCGTNTEFWFCVYSLPGMDYLKIVSFEKYK